MGQILQGCAKTTEAVRRAIQNSQESLKTIAKRYSINPKTVAKWKKRSSAQDAPMGPKNPRSSILSVEEEAICVTFRKHNYYHWMIVCMPCKPIFLIYQDHPCIAVSAS